MQIQAIACVLDFTLFGSLVTTCTQAEIQKQEGTNLLCWCSPLQANHVAVQDAAASVPSQMLALQVLRLRQCVDAMSAQLRALHSKDLVDNLRAKQALQGRDRRPRTMVL